MLLSIVEKKDRRIVDLILEFVSRELEIIYAAIIYIHFLIITIGY